MMTIRRRMRPFLEPAVALAALAAWWSMNASSYVTFIPMRSQYEFTNPYHVMIALALSVSIALVRALPRFSLGIAACALLTQLVAWPSRFSNENWTAYLMMLLIAAGLSLYGSPALRKVAISLGLPAAVLVSALLNVPALSTTGEFGLINGKPAQSPDVPTGFAITAVVMLALLSFVWYLAHVRRRKSTEDFDTAAGAGPASSPSEAELKELTPREREVYFLIAEGLTTNEIAIAAHIEESTVKSHISSILAKLGLTSRTAIVAHAYRNGFLIPDSSSSTL